MSYHYIPIIDSKGHAYIFTSAATNVPLKVHKHALELMRSVPSFTLLEDISYLRTDEGKCDDMTVGWLHSLKVGTSPVKWGDIRVLVEGYRELGMLPDDWKEHDDV